MTFVWCAVPGSSTRMGGGILIHPVPKVGHVRLDVKGRIMIRYYEQLSRKVNDLNTDVKTFFRMAHIHKFGTDPDLGGDVLRFKVAGIIPQYVCEYIDSLE